MSVDSSKLPTVQDLYDGLTNMTVFKEILTSSSSVTPSKATDGKQKITIEGFRQESQDQLNTQESEFNSQLSTQESEFNSQLDAQQQAFDAATIAAINASGYSVVEGSFQDGATLTNRAEAVWYEGDPINNYSGQGFYAWNGTYPKTVTASSTPADEQGWAYAAAGYSKQTSAILFMGTNIDHDLTIPAGNNGISYKPVIDPGVSVTVPPGSTWKILGDAE